MSHTDAIRDAWDSLAPAWHAHEIEIPEESDGTCAVPYARAIFTRDGTRAYIPAVQLCEAPAVYHSWLYAIDITE